MNEKEIEQYLKENLSINIEKSGGSYGSQVITEIQLKLKGETISTIYIDD
jgi:hypothetical protein